MAVSFCGTGGFPYFWGYLDTCAYPRAGYVEVRQEQPETHARGRPIHDKKIHWKMFLERFYNTAGNPHWNVVDTRTGYTSNNSPTYRNFTNIATQRGDKMRVMVQYWTDPDTSYRLYTNEWST